MSVMLLPLLVSACTGGGDADYTLRLEPVLPKNQAGLLDDLDRIDLVVTNETGSERFPLDSFGSGQSAELSDMAALDGTTLSLEGYDGNRLEAFGTTDALDLTTGDESIAILVARVDDFAELTNLPDPLFDGVMSYDGAGSVVLFGGNEGVREEDEATPEIWSLSLSPPTTGLVFEDTNEELPVLDSENDPDAAGRIGASATLLTTGAHDEIGQVLVVGGTQVHFVEDGEFLSPAAGLDVSKTAGLWSADDESFDELSVSDALEDRRSHHTATENGAGDVVIIGGFGRTSDKGYFATAGQVEIYSPALGATETAGGSTDIPTVFHAAARLGADGVLACGGFDAATAETNTSCWTVDISGQIDELDLPSSTGLLHLGMAPLPNGKVLLAGGLEVDGTVDYFTGTYRASKSAWIYDGSDWTTTTEMNHPHAMHAMAELPDGRVLVAGGTTGVEVNETTTSWGVMWDPTKAIGCAEVFDPSDQTWTDIGSCDEDGGEGALGEPVVAPMVAVDPRYGALIVGGINRDDKPSDNVVLFVSAARAE